ncbi:hypothetical protein Glove_33g209 [Diversispora epigaea]|uniref:Uncharacterized protein n=1 Tax=Diversispora epigaea TaxID=1348612 RepID=A0A397JGU5_9GLOM|nr:hypothetical protein Glove_33g209 [Diversispora epigaea]
MSMNEKIALQILKSQLATYLTNAQPMMNVNNCTMLIISSLSIMTAASLVSSTSTATTFLPATKINPTAMTTIKYHNRPLHNTITSHVVIEQTVAAQQHYSAEITATTNCEITVIKYQVAQQQLLSSSRLLSGNLISDVIPVISSVTIDD